MTLLLVIMLGVLWGAVFLPSVLRARLLTSPMASVGSFRRGMMALRPRTGPQGRWVVMPPAPLAPVSSGSPEIPRRRRIFLFLLLSAVATLMVGLIPAYRELLRFHLLIDVALGGYVAYLIRLKGPSDEEFEIDEEDLDAYEDEIVYEEQIVAEDETPGIVPEPSQPKPEPIYEPAYAEAVAPDAMQEPRRRYAPRHSVGDKAERPKARKILLSDIGDDEESPPSTEAYPRAKEA